MNKGFRKMCDLTHPFFCCHSDDKKFRKISRKRRIPDEKKFLLKQVYYL
jgi:hypothetical protein